MVKDNNNKIKRKASTVKPSPNWVDLSWCSPTQPSPRTTLMGDSWKCSWWSWFFLKNSCWECMIDDTDQMRFIKNFNLNRSSCLFWAYRVRSNLNWPSNGVASRSCVHLWPLVSSNIHAWLATSWHMFKQASLSVSFVRRITENMQRYGTITPFMQPSSFYCSNLIVSSQLSSYVVDSMMWHNWSN